MRYSTRTRYGLRFLINLAGRPAGLVDVPVAKSVRYIWKSGAFEKTVSGKPE